MSGYFTSPEEGKREERKAIRVGMKTKMDKTEC